jgi:tRNA(Ile)-lysidine synthase
MKRKNSNALLLDKKTQHIYLNFKNFLISHLKGKKFLVAVSGGPDSLALAYLSKIFCNELNYSFSAIIIDHGVRKRVIGSKKS